MKKMIKEFREFIDQGDFVTIAVGLVLAISVKQVIDSIVEGVVNPIVSAIVGKPNLSDFGFDLRDGRVSIGVIITALIQFLAVAFVIFFMLKVYNGMRSKLATERGDDVVPETELSVLRDIRKQLENR
jgi:large conductance mechanosensitive channel